MTSNGNDPETEPTDEPTDEPTVEEQGVMTPDQDAVDDANASGVNPDK